MFSAARKIACATALSASLVLIIPAAVFAQDQDHRDSRQQQGSRDWANNSSYQMGQREGNNDHQRNRKKNHKHKFKSDEDRRAYSAGYDNAWQGNQDRDKSERDRNPDVQDRPH